MRAALHARGPRRVEVGAIGPAVPCQDPVGLVGRDQVTVAVVVQVRRGEAHRDRQVRDAPGVSHLDELTVGLLEPQAIGLLGRVGLGGVLPQPSPRCFMK